MKIIFLTEFKETEKWSLGKAFTKQENMKQGAQIMCPERAMEFDLLRVYYKFVCCPDYKPPP